MSKIQNKAQSRIPKISILAMWVLLLGFCSSCALGIVSVFLIRSLYILHVSILTLSMSGLIGLIMGLLSLIRIKLDHRRVVKHGLAELGIVTASVLMMFFGVVLQRGVQGASQILCGTNLSRLGTAIRLYSDENDGKYPISSRWCDLLLQGGHVTEKHLVCESAKHGRCHYAMNPNCEPNSPGGMVLLFETEGGWNQSGGPEILTTENHAGKGCNVLFNDGSVKFVEPEELGKLKWKVEEPNTIE
jgi:prepilin-type processing-associated H-X9-DG protein